jgi:hypothetical protein
LYFRLRWGLKSKHARRFAALGAGSVARTITTDGNLGTLATGDISAFNLNVSDGNGTIDLVSALDTEEVLGTISGLSATSTGLFFNYSLNAGFLI